MTAYVVMQSATAVSSVAFTSVRLDEVAAFYECHQRAVEDGAARRVSEGAAVGAAGDVEASLCHDPRAGMGWFLPSLMALAFVLAIAVAYWLLPGWRTRHRGYVLLSGVVAPEVESRLSFLVELAGVGGRVVFLLEPLNPCVQGLAFGRVGRRHVVLSSGLLALHSRDRDSFDAVVLHELAHVRNRDLDIGFLTLLVGRSAVLLLPALVLSGLGSLSVITSPAGASQMSGTMGGHVPSGALAAGLSATFGGLFLGAVILLLRNAVLRSRELDADARAVEWMGTAEPLQRVLAHAVEQPPASNGSRGYAHLLNVHPLPSTRVRKAVQPGPSVRIAPLDLFAVGLITAYLYALMKLGPLGGGTLATTVTDAVAALAATMLLVGVVGVTVWSVVESRGLHHAEMGSAQRLHGLRRAGIGLGLGLFTARILSPSLASSAAMVGGHGVSMVFPYVVLCAAAGWGAVSWLERVATAWVAAVRDSRRPRLLMWTAFGLSAAGTWPAMLFLLSLPEWTLYAASFVAPGWPGAAAFFLSAQRMSQVSMTAWASVAIPTVCVLLSAGRWWSWRPAAAAARGEFGPARPPGRLWARLGVPSGLAVTVILTPVALLSTETALWVTIGAAQLTAAFWAGRGPALLPVARATLAAYGAGFVATYTWAVQVGLLGCMVGTNACQPLWSLGSLSLAVTTAAPGALFAAGSCAVLYRRSRRGHHRAR
ncbi:M48 family metalloprotease [Streptomyces sp. JH34]|uniref:M48 family metalloprotease n=1 Tax=Streptomyces sp. JH34 TaxID=2793633 RepID=UPI0023F75F40|nr:M48 family metalloprotease [Streptomyces sp. JH34]MDF6023093.1 M48 family metalloprotease [Streptomyces sp. JH34]